MLQGPAVDLYKDIMQHFPECKLIASGGVSCLDDLKTLNNAGIPPLFSAKLYTKEESH